MLTDITASVEGLETWLCLVLDSNVNILVLDSISNLYNDLGQDYLKNGKCGLYSRNKILLWICNFSHVLKVKLWRKKKISNWGLGLGCLGLGLKCQGLGLDLWLGCSGLGLGLGLGRGGLDYNTGHCQLKIVERR